MGKILNWVRAHALVSVAAAFFLGIGAGASGSETETPVVAEEQTADAPEEEPVEETDFSPQVAILEDQVADAEALAAEAEDRAAEAERLADKAVRDLNARKRKLDQRESKIKQAEVRVAKSTFDDGIWQVGNDIEPGLYRSPGGSSCYWAELNSADTNDISSNGFSGTNQTVQIDTAFFQTESCGIWKKIG